MIFHLTNITLKRYEQPLTECIQTYATVCTAVSGWCISVIEYRPARLHAIRAGFLEALLFTITELGAASTSEK